MFTIKEKTVNEIVIQKSRFICVLDKLENKDDLENILKEIKNTYKGATHYCYAYIINSSQKYDDDGEPSGTAGNPILNVLKFNNLNNVVAIVIRYFGGIKLGAGGLVRAYTKSVTECLKLCNTEEERQWITFQINVDYDNLKYIYKYINETYIKEKSFDNLITLSIKMPYDEYLSIKESINSISQIL